MLKQGQKLVPSADRTGHDRRGHCFINHNTLRNETIKFNKTDNIFYIYNKKYLCKILVLRIGDHPVLFPKDNLYFSFPSRNNFMHTKGKNKT